MYLWLDTEKGMEFRRQVPVKLSQPPWNNDEGLTKNISVFPHHPHHHHHHGRRRRIVVVVVVIVVVVVVIVAS